MSEETMVDESTDMESYFGETMTEDQAKEAAAGNLVPKGKWRGQLEKAELSDPISTENGEHPFEGKRITRCQVRLYTDEGEKVTFFDAHPSVVKATSKKGGRYMRTESQNAAFLFTATKMHGKPWGDVLNYAKENFLVYDIGVKKATDDYPAKNTLRGILPDSEG